MGDRGGRRGRVLVIGAGVVGLTSALELRRAGFEVALVADRFAPRVTSVVAGALWEWPPAVCGHHRDSDSLRRAKGWSAASYGLFTDLARDPSTGVRLRPVTFYFRGVVEDDPFQRQKRDELRALVRGFRQGPALLDRPEVNPTLGLRDAYAYLAPMIDTDQYMPWLLASATAEGVRIEEARIEGPVRDREAELRRRYGADAIAVCAGLGAAELTGDAVSPLRGALVRVRNDGRAMPRVEEGHCISQEPGDGPGFLFIIPRGDDMLLLGGFAEPGETGLDIGLENYEPIRAMFRRCVEFLPALRHAEIDPDEPVRVGLRPYREGNVRLEHEPGTRIVHNYGHGGSGVTFSWGCAREAASLVARALDGA